MLSSDKILGFFMILVSFVIIGGTVVCTIVLPIMGYNMIGYYFVAGIITLAVIAIMLLVAWIGWNLLKTRAPEIVLEDIKK